MDASGTTVIGDGVNIRNNGYRFCGVGTLLPRVYNQRRKKTRSFLQQEAKWTWTRASFSTTFK